MQIRGIVALQGHLSPTGNAGKWMDVFELSKEKQRVSSEPGFAGDSSAEREGFEPSVPVIGTTD